MGMSYLLDTHILLWWLFDDPKLDDTCRDIIRSPQNCILVSSASAWEIATKYRIGKLPEAIVLASFQKQQNWSELIRKLCKRLGFLNFLSLLHML